MLTPLRDQFLTQPAALTKRIAADVPSHHHLVQNDVESQRAEAAGKQATCAHSHLVIISDS